MGSRRMDRRTFLRTARKVALVAAAPPALATSRLLGRGAPSETLAIAAIGTGGRTRTLIKELAGLKQRIVALCDVDARSFEQTRREVGDAVAGAREYADYRALLDRETTIDAVVIGTPDHWHMPISKAAIRAGKHVFCEKPLAHSVAEARELREVSRASKVVTQTGNQGSASEGIRRAIEVIQAGVFGPIREVHLWHPPHGWPSGIDRPAGEDPIPQGLDWNFWIGPSPMRPYKSGVYHPGAWRGWYDFGGGSLADFCCHGFNLPVRALELDYPERIEVSGKGMGKESFPTACRVRYTFPARKARPAVTLTFHTGGELPPADVIEGMAATHGTVPTTGCLLVGREGTLSSGLWNSECDVRMKGDGKFRWAGDHPATAGIPRSLPRTSNHTGEWVEACKGGPPVFCDFDIGGHLTEIGLAGIVALRLGRDIEWDGPEMRAKGVPEADRIIRKEYRPKWRA